MPLRVDDVVAPWSWDDTCCKAEVTRLLDCVSVLSRRAFGDKGDGWRGRWRLPAGGDLGVSIGTAADGGADPDLEELDTGADITLLTCRNACLVQVRGE